MRSRHEFTTLRKHFTSTLEYANWVRPYVEREASRPYNYRATFASIGLGHLTNGTEQHVEQARSFMSQLQERIEVPHFTWESAPMGYFPNVPAFLAGTPDSMWTRTVIRTDRTPLRVYVAVSTIASVSEAQIIKRGVMLAAFALAMVEIRPVYITPWVDLANSYTGSIITWDIQTSPLVLSQLMASLVQPNVTRHLGIEACRYHLADACGMPHPDYRNPAAMRAHLNCNPDDLLIPELLPDDPMLNDPLTWLQQTIARYTPEED